MKQNPLPRDLARYAARARLWRILPFCVLEGLMITLLALLGDRLFGKELHLFYRILLYALLLAVPFLLTKFPFNLRERTFRGRVVAVSIDRTLGIWYAGSRPASRGGMASFRTTGFRAATMRLSVALPDGKVIRQKLPAPIPPNTPPAVGEEVFHLFGSDHVMTLPTPADDHVHCAVCNDINAPNADRCRCCGRTMVR